MTCEQQRYTNLNDAFIDESSVSGLSRISDETNHSRACVILNADDWGRDVETTDRSLECTLQGVISSVSAMVFMEDSKRAANLALGHRIDAGLHLNLTTPFDAAHCPSKLVEHQRKLHRFLTFESTCAFVLSSGTDPLV